MLKINLEQQKQQKINMKSYTLRKVLNVNKERLYHRFSFTQVF